MLATKLIRITMIGFWGIVAFMLFTREMWFSETQLLDYDPSRLRMFSWVALALLGYNATRLFLMARSQPTETLAEKLEARREQNQPKEVVLPEFDFSQSATPAPSPQRHSPS
jgi:hypothetical protein